MKKWGLALMLVAVMGLPALACGFPLPVTVQSDETAMEPAGVVCAATEAPESCQMRQDAYALMASLSSGSVEDMNMSLTYNADADAGNMKFSGYYDFVVNPDAPGLGMDISATLVEGTIDNAGDQQDISNAQFAIIGGTGYSKEEGDASWTQEDLTSDAETVLGLAVVLGMGGSDANLFTDPASFTVEMLPDVEMMGQAMHVQKLSLDLTSLMMSPDALGGLFNAGAAASGGALGEEELGMSSEDIAMLAPMLMGFMGGSEFTTTIYIGAEDGFIHRVEDNYVFNMDMSALDPTTPPVSMIYMLEGNITNHNGIDAIAAPEGAVEGEGGLFDDLGGSGGLGDSLFGG